MFLLPWFWSICSWTLNILSNLISHCPVVCVFPHRKTRKNLLSSFILLKSRLWWLSLFLNSEKLKTQWCLLILKDKGLRWPREHWLAFSWWNTSTTALVLLREPASAARRNDALLQKALVYNFLCSCLVNNRGNRAAAFSRCLTNS